MKLSLKTVHEKERRKKNGGGEEGRKCSFFAWTPPRETPLYRPFKFQMGLAEIDRLRLCTARKSEVQKRKVPDLGIARIERCMSYMAWAVG